MRAMWRELWWKMAGGIKSEYDKIKGTSVFEFWQLFGLWKEQTKRDAEHLKARLNKK